jgi:hypothetical protein
VFRGQKILSLYLLEFDHEYPRIFFPAVLLVSGCGDSVGIAFLFLAHSFVIRHSFDIRHSDFVISSHRIEARETPATAGRRELTPIRAQRRPFSI